MVVCLRGVARAVAADIIALPCAFTAVPVAARHTILLALHERPWQRQAKRVVSGMVAFATIGAISAGVQSTSLSSQGILHL